MKFYSLVVVILASFAASSAQAIDLSEGQPLTYAFDWPWSPNLQPQINHLNRMVGHVRWQFSRYHSTRQLQQDYWQIRHEVDQLNARFKRGGYNKSQMRSEIERLRGRLHALEVSLKVKKADIYRWR